MSPPSDTRQPTVLGDFVVGLGPEAGAWVRGLAGFQPITDAGEPAQAAIRGPVQHGRTPDGARFVALADLIDGRVDDGVRALATGTPPHAGFRGRFAQVVWSRDGKSAAGLTDHFSTLSLYALQRGDTLLYATDLRLLSRSPFSRREIDLEGVYHYFNFAQIPAPRTIFRDIERLEPATRLSWQAGRAASRDRYYVPEYPEDLHDPDGKLAADLRDKIVSTVKSYRPGDAWGCFLSGGTDSSSIVSILARELGPGKVKSFSIGFAEEGYDELGYARIAAQACGADPTYGTVSRDQTEKLVARMNEAYDQPFGGASSVATIACADLARERGVEMLVAGDGGDEIFGGNERYAKDKVMEAYFALPAPVKAMGSAVRGAVGGSNVLFLNRVENFFNRASLPNPDRFYTDDSFASDYYDELLTPDFRKAVRRDASLEHMRSVYGLGRTGGPLHRVMRLDLLHAIAQHDLRKVDSATRSVGVSVRFPYLDPALVAYTNRLPEKYKVRGLTKRYLFKRAMKGILPEEIIRKKKQGFGLPIAVWMRSDPVFQRMVKETLFDGRARARGWWDPGFAERLLGEHVRGSWDHSDYLWRLFILEQWLRSHVDA